MYGENLVLERRIEAEVGTDTVIFHDRVRNLGFYATPHALLYHVNLGWPVVDKGTRLAAPIKSTPFTTHDPHAVEFGPLEQPGPQSKFYQQVYEHEVVPQEDGTARAALINSGFRAPGGEMGLALEIAYDSRTLPALYQWQNLQEGNYVVAMEPATVHGGTRADWLERGEMVILEHGDQREYRLAVTPPYRRPGNPIPGGGLTVALNRGWNSEENRVTFADGGRPGGSLNPDPRSRRVGPGGSRLENRARTWRRIAARR